MIDFILGMVSVLGIILITSLIFLVSFKKEKTFNNTHKFLTIPIINENELKDGKIYHLVKRAPYSNNFYFHSAKWDSKIKAFKFSSYYDKYEDVIAVLTETSKPIITDYNPSKINAFDIEELNKICFDLSNENTESDEIWEKLIEYFDKRGLSK